jgi:uncharacterized protein HemX
VSEILSAVGDGGIVAFCILAVLAFGTNLVYTKAQHNAIVTVKDQLIADQKALIAVKDAQIEKQADTIGAFEEPLKAVGYFFTESMKVRQPGGG